MYTHIALCQTLPDSVYRGLSGSWNDTLGPPSPLADPDDCTDALRNMASPGVFLNPGAFTP